MKDIYDDFVVSVDANMNQEEVAQIMQKYDLTVLPVVNKRKKLLNYLSKKNKSEYSDLIKKLNIRG